MTATYTRYVPKTVGELMDLLGSMMLQSPTFVDKTGRLPGRNIDTTFYALNEGLKTIRKKIGEEKYQTLVELSNKMRSLFEADPRDETGETIAGRDIILDMEDILKRK